MAVSCLCADAQGEPTVQFRMRGPVCAEASTDQVPSNAGQVGETRFKPLRTGSSGKILLRRLHSSYVPRCRTRRAVTDGTSDALRS